MGTYKLTFQLPGFTSVVREGVVLKAGFTATINVEMTVGSLEETITVLNQGTFSFVPNPLLLDEMIVEAGGNAAVSGSGLSINAIPREGSNAFSFMTTGLLSTSGMQADNLTEEWIRRGINSRWAAQVESSQPARRGRLRSVRQQPDGASALGGAVHQQGRHGHRR